MIPTTRTTNQRSETSLELTAVLSAVPLPATNSCQKKYKDLWVEILAFKREVGEKPKHYLEKWLQLGKDQVKQGFTKENISKILILESLFPILSWVILLSVNYQVRNNDPIGLECMLSFLELSSIIRHLICCNNPRSTVTIYTARQVFINQLWCIIDTQGQQTFKHYFNIPVGSQIQGQQRRPIIIPGNSFSWV